MVTGEGTPLRLNLQHVEGLEDESIRVEATAIATRPPQATCMFRASRDLALRSAWNSLYGSANQCTPIIEAWSLSLSL
jgi:hypothetical protein